MNYQIILNGSQFLSGNLVGSFFLLVIILAILGGAANIIFRRIWAKIRENEVLKYEFITIIAHKFRSPLTTTKWLLEGDLADETDPRKRESIVEMQRNTEKLISMTGTLIEMTDTDNESKSSYAFDTVNLCDFVKTITEANKNMFHEKNLFFSTKCEVAEVNAKVDKPRLEFVLQTLLENAVAYTPPGRNVDVTVGSDGRSGIIAVADNGIGIAPADISKIFTKFYRTKNAKDMDTEGFGVGLFLSQSIIRRHKGKLSVYSSGLNQGTVFTISLPIVK